MPEVITKTDFAETDFHQWALDTAASIQKRQFTAVDWDRVAEELHSLGKSEERELESRLAQLMYHLLKEQYQPEGKTRSWQLTIENQRNKVVQLLNEQPSLKTKMADREFLQNAYKDALGFSGPENLPDTVVNLFPANCPFGSEILG